MAGQGSNDKIAGLLKQACPPAAASPEFKATLRQQVNQQAAALGTQVPKPLWQQPFVWIPAAAAMAVAAALIIYFVAFPTTPPSVTSTDATGIQTTAATLNGTLDSLGTADSVTVSFEWGSAPGSYIYTTADQARKGIGAFSADLSGLTPGTTYYYRAKADGDGSPVYGEEKSFGTPTTLPSVITNDATSLTTTSATINGTLDSMGTEDNVRVSFEWGNAPGWYIYTTPDQSRTSVGAFSADLSGLTPGTTYYYRAKADVDGVPVYGSEKSFVAPTTSPSVSTNDASSVTTASATLNGTLDSMGTEDNVTVSFEWGTARGSYTYATADQGRALTGDFSADLSGLTPGTTYYYRAKADGDGAPVYGGEETFTTSTTPPSVTTNDAGNVGTTSATLNGDLTSLGTAGSVMVSFEWGTAPGSYTYATADQGRALTGAFSADLSGLTPGTTYYYRAKADGDGEPVYGGEETFTTPTTPPSVTTNDAGNVGTTSATLNGDLTSLGTAGSVMVSFEWGTAPGSYTYTTADQSRTLTGDFSAGLSGLTPGTTYYYRAKADGDGVPVYGDEESFDTPTRPPSVTGDYATDVTTSSATLNGDLTLLGTAGSVIVSFEWGTAPGSYTYTTADQARTLTGDFSAGLSGLTPGTTYYYRAKADGDGPPVYGDEESFTTLTAPPAVTTGSATEVHCTSSTLNGILESLGTSDNVEVSFEWGMTTAYGNETASQVLTTTGGFSVNLTGLTPRTTYHFRARAIGHGNVYGDDNMFATGTVPPAQKTWYLSADDIGAQQVMYDGDISKPAGIIQLSSWGLTSLIWNANESSGDTKYPAGSWLVQLTLGDFEKSHTDNIEIGTWDGNVFTPYGVNVVYGLGDGVYVVNASISVGSFTVPPGGCVAVRITVTSSPQLLNVHVGAVNGFVRSPSFPETTAPSVATSAATNVEQTTAILNGYLDSLGTAGSVTVCFEWGMNAEYGQETQVGALTSDGSFSFILTDLAPNTTYHFRAEAVGDGANYGVDMIFTTPP